MMQITRETDYAIRCVYYLARKPDEVTMVDEIAREMCVPKSFLAKIAQKLTKANILQSYRGVKGGFQLFGKPEDISIYDVIEAVEGPVAMNVCAVDKKECGLSAKCKIHPIWVELRKEVETLLRERNFSQFK
ncbi:MAG: Rrf2 family transcriptional regulator [Nitrospirae bacterium]|nr:Rrf2 family transcriptional regulator [Nitrospirota bacterium]MCL5977431.1 Rrf2 family transcriptional regulator [Nitrospirota bacterium]